MKKIIAALLIAFAMPTFAMDLKCMGKPKNDSQFDGVGGFNKQEQRQAGFDAIENPAQELMACAAAVTQGGSAVSLVTSTCQCMEKIKDLCQYSITKKGKVQYDLKGGASLAACLVFPLTAWTKL